MIIKCLGGLLSVSLDSDSEPLCRVTEKSEWEAGDEQLKGRIEERQLNRLVTGDWESSLSPCQAAFS